MSTMHEIDVTNTKFQHLVEQTDIFAHSDSPRKVWMLVEREVTGIAIHIFPQDPLVGITPPVERKLGIWTQMTNWFGFLLQCLTSRKPPLLIPYIPYSMAMIGIQIEIHDNKVESVIWNPVPSEDDFEEDSDAPPNPTVEILIDNIDSYLPSKEQDSDPLDENSKKLDEGDGLDDQPF